MRRILMPDIVATAHLIAQWPEADRPAVLDRLLDQTQAADRFCRRLGRPHPRWGNGSLLGRALAENRDSGPEDHRFWSSLGLVAIAIAARRRVLAGCRLGASGDDAIC